MDNNTKQVLVIRKDLKMRKGKIAAQAAHASMKTFLDYGKFLTNDDSDTVFVFSLSEDWNDWLMGLFTKICVSVNSEDELLEIYDAAVDEGLPCSLIQDAGLTEFGGVKTYTAVAVGPGKNERVDTITKGLPLL